jgi:hypothetical protein
MLRTLLILLCVLAVPWPVHAQQTGVRIELAVDRDTVENFGKISVRPKIVNAGFEDQALQFFLCSYDDSWTVDNPAVILEARQCDKNPLYKIVLKPGETYENTQFPLVVSLNVPPEEISGDGVTFRLGFKTDVLHKTDTSQPFVWSEPVTVKIKE